MTKDGIRAFLTAVKSKTTVNQNRVGRIISSCPFAPWRHDHGVDKHPSFAVEIKEGGVSRYNCFSCNSHGDLGDMVQELAELLGKNKEGYDFQTALQLIAHEEDELELIIKDYKDSDGYQEETVVFPEWWLDSFLPALHSKDATEYLKKRGLTNKTIHKLDIRYDNVRHRVCFPIRDWDGFLVGLHGRTIEKDGEPRYFAYGYKEQRNKLPWLGEAWINPDEIVCLVESVFDLAAVYQHHNNVMCSLSAGLSKAKVKRLKDLGDLFTMYDHGKGGDSARQTLEKYLNLDKVGLFHIIPTEEQGDPGNMTPEEIVDALED